MPDTEDPTPPSIEPSPEEEQMTGPAEISLDEYHVRADAFQEAALAALESAQEGRQDLEVEFSDHILTVEVGGKGTWVLNKQAANRQLWLSSPVSGPKRYDWVVVGESMSSKEGGGQGDWIYLRDRSSLPDLLRREWGITVAGGEIS